MSATVAWDINGPKDHPQIGKAQVQAPQPAATISVGEPSFNKGRQVQVVIEEEKTGEGEEVDNEISRQMKQASQEEEMQAIIVSEKQELAALEARKFKKGKLSRKDQERMDTLRSRAARRKEQQAISGIGGQAVIESAVAIQPEPTLAISVPPNATIRTESTAAIRLEEDCPALATTFSIVSEIVVNGVNTMAPNSMIKSLEYHPKAGRYFMIRTRTEPHYILTVENGELRLLEKPTLGGGSFWHCVKRSGWHTFCNSVTGTNLHHDGQGKISIQRAHNFFQNMDGYFTTERHEDGGYILLMKHGDELSQVAISGDGKCLIEQKEDGTAWDFIEARYVSSSMILTYSNI
ncbi:hypothetical protein T069G_01907 [Trichoderma breve]|uniref:Uncharacterized protein n=1 Tax=Trichoderma breve TaxID=2034170 RepID=A0A9W9EEK9_9HYPO|nr:hypothetical protein T069G_01907 [Trichoderma breve]KAJ4865377.1 hypothetical protein T069G_01907 [Trichoderma breve]